MYIEICLSTTNIQRGLTGENPITLRKGWRNLVLIEREALILFSRLNVRIPHELFSFVISQHGLMPSFQPVLPQFHPLPRLTYATLLLTILFLFAARS